MNANLLINEEHNGLELYFSEKPEDAVLNALREAKWRYHRAKGCWYARQTPANLEIAKRFADGEADKLPPEAPAPFMPAYTEVDSAPIYASSDISCWENDEGYFADIKAYVEVRVQRIIIVDLRDALVPGRECERLTLEPHDVYNSECLHAGLDTFRAVYEKFFVRRELPDCHVYTSTEKGMRVFTPFKRIRPIEPPTKWTLSHVWKAILSGQIYQGQCDGRYTDDNAYDAAVNFRSGVGLHLPSFAKQLIESPSGWSVYVDRQEGEQIQLSVNCHSFNMNTLFFDKDCEWAENERRRLARKDELDRHNADMKSRVLSRYSVEEKSKTGLLFDVQLLEYDDNTDRYEACCATMNQAQLIIEDWREVLAVEPHPIADADLFEIDCRNSLEEDERVILIDNSAVVTGKALIELLAGPQTAKQIATVNVRHQDIAKLRSDLHDQLTGRVRNLFNPTPIERIQTALNRLNREEERIHESK